jgi:hypothetical protein
MVVMVIIVVITWLVCEVDYSHLVLTLGMNGAILLLPPYAFMSWTGATLLYVHD